MEKTHSNVTWYVNLDDINTNVFRQLSYHHQRNYAKPIRALKTIHILCKKRISSIVKGIFFTQTCYCREDFVTNPNLNGAARNTKLLRHSVVDSSKVLKSKRRSSFGGGSSRT